MSLGTTYITASTGFGNISVGLTDFVDWKGLHRRGIQIKVREKSIDNFGNEIVLDVERARLLHEYLVKFITEAYGDPPPPPQSEVPA